MMSKLGRIFGLILIATLALIAAQSVASAEEDVILQRKEDRKLEFTGPTSHEAIVETAVQSTGSSLRVAGLWLVLIGAGAGGLVLLRRKKLMAEGVLGKSSKLTMVERLSVGANREVLLIKACDRMLVIGVMANQMSILSDLPTDDSPSQQPFQVASATPPQKSDEQQVASRQAFRAFEAQVAEPVMGWPELETVK